MPMPSLSICIVNWNTREDLIKAIESLESSGVEDCEIIVVDNASCDDSVEAVRHKFPSVTLLENHENYGFSRAYNQAIKQSRGKYILLLNPDCVVHPRALEQLIEFMETSPKTAAVGPRLLNGDGSLQYSCRRFPTFATGLFRNTPLGRLFPRNRFSRQYLMTEWEHNEAREVDWISGAAICIRREALEQIGLLDEEFFMYCEDVDWCYRAHKKGWAIQYLPTATVTHLIGRSSDQRPLEMVKEFHRSMAHFCRKHYSSHWPIGFRWVPLAAIKLRMLVALLHHRLSIGKTDLRSKPCPEEKSQN